MHVDLASVHNLQCSTMHGMNSAASLIVGTTAVLILHHDLMLVDLASVHILQAMQHNVCDEFCCILDRRRNSCDIAINLFTVGALALT